MLHCKSKLAWYLGITALLLILVQSTDGRWHNLHRVRHSSEAVRPLVPPAGDEDQPLVRHPRHDDSYEDEEEYRDEDSFDDEDSSSEYEEIQRVPPRHRLVGRKIHAGRHQRHHHVPLTGKFGEGEDPMNLAREHLTQRHRSRGKRLSQRRHWTDKDRESFERRPLPLDHERRDYELEVREAQNSSLCNYTVIPIPDPGGRIPRELEHVKCNHVGSRCQDRGTYCCIQTYRNMEIMYEGGRTEMMKVYSGCVCSLQIYGTLEPYTPELEINY